MFYLFFSSHFGRPRSRSLLPLSIPYPINFLYYPIYFTTLYKKKKADKKNKKSIYNAYFTGSSDQDLDAFKTSLQDTAIPAMENCITTISNIEVATDEVKALKDSYLQSVQKECEAMKMVVSAIDGENADYLTQADSLIAEAATLRSDYQTKLQAIANEQGIVVNQ